MVIRGKCVWYALILVFIASSVAFAVGNPALNFAKSVFQNEREPNPEVFSFIKKLGYDRKLDENEKLYIEWLAQVDPKLQHRFLRYAMDGRITRSELEALPDLPVLYEDFKDNRNGWPEVSTYQRKMFVRNGAFYIEMQRKDLTAICVPANVQPYIERYPDYTYGADISIKASGYKAPWVIYGLMFRVQDLHNFYMFLYRGDGKFSLQVLYGGKPKLIKDWTSGPLDFSSMKVVVRGDHIRCYVFGAGEGEKKVFDVHDSRLSSGGIGLIAMGSVKVKFRNLRVVVPKEEAWR